MPWSAPFLSKLRSTLVQPRFLLNSIEPPERIGKGNWTMTSDENVDGLPILAQSGWAAMGTEVTPKTWASTTGTWSVPLVGDIRGLQTRLWRGQLVELRMGFPGWDESEFEPVALGAVWNLTGRPGLWTLKMRDIYSALQSRFAKDVQEQQLFHDVGTSTTVGTPGYTAGAGTINVASTTGFQRQDNGTGTLKGVIQVTGNSGTTFFLTYTGVTATTFTGLSAAGQFGTSTENSSTGGIVVEFAYIDDHPIDFVGRVLVSDGSFSSNGLNTLPKSWGIGLPNRLIDEVDMNRWRNHTTPATGTGDWDIVVGDPQANPLSFVRNTISRGGFFLTIRQGRITIRPATNPNASNLTAQIPSVNVFNDAITDAEIDEDFGGLQWESWDNSYGVEFRRVRVLTATGQQTNDEPISGLPAGDLLEYDLSDVIFSNQSNQRDVIINRLGVWALRIPERLVIPCVGLKRWEHTPGDIVPLTTRAIGGRLDTTRDGYENRRVMITRVNPDPWNNRVILQAAVLPNKTDDFD